MLEYPVNCVVYLILESAKGMLGGEEHAPHSLEHYIDHDTRPSLSRAHFWWNGELFSGFTLATVTRVCITLILTFSPQRIHSLLNDKIKLAT